MTVAELVAAIEEQTGEPISSPSHRDRNVALEVREEMDVLDVVVASSSGKTLWLRTRIA